ncbi:hypothetical protein ASC77_14195 [Nocardioides sp. Root1257]|nr:hypothetical protein ASC77_14195 [Nocardioides sp. Root1257]KRC45748.1 hypothetical protein ASE24_14200 [Nocardioides sp. Root224]
MGAHLSITSLLGARLAEPRLGSLGEQGVTLQTALRCGVLALALCLETLLDTSGQRLVDLQPDLS